jgi:flagellar assembly protein FliH
VPEAAPFIRRADAGAISAARFDVDLRAGFPVPEHIVAEATAAAHAAGFAAGWAQGQRESEVRTQALHTHLQDEAEAALAGQQQVLRRATAGLGAAAVALEQQVTATATELEDLILHTAFDIAEAVLGRELELGAEPGKDALARALALAPANRPVTVRVSPADHAALTAAGGLPPQAGGREITLVADPQVRSGDAMADSDATAIDARISTALGRIRQVLG